jgi:hypothetical protein
MGEPDYVELAKRARDLLEPLGAPLAAQAFPPVLADLIRQARSSQVSPRILAGERADSPSLVPTNPSALDTFLTRNVDTSKYTPLFLASGRLTDKALAVLRIARDEFGIEGVGAAEIANILKRRFRVSQVHPSNLSRDLGNAPEFVSRVEIDGQSRYVLTLKGETRLADALKSP